MLRNLLLLTAEAERKIRAAGRTPPPREFLMSALATHAKLVTRAARAAATAERQSARAQALAKECASAAVSMADALADACIEALPAQPAFAELDPARFTVTLARVPGSRQPSLTAGDLS
jgi:hypothetical protein